MSAQGRAVAPPRVARRLAAILAADVVGYSRLTGRDEAGTIARLRAVRKKLVEPIIARHGGRIVKLMGDGALVEFPSVVDAVEAAVVVQRGMAGYDHGREGADRIRFRIGVNLGDIVVDGDDILGDGVNIASRLEGLAEPGGICVSGTVHEQIRDKLPYTFEDTGEQAVKNIARPVRVYALGSEALASLPEVVATVRPRAARRTTAVRGILAAAAQVIVVLAGSWWFRPSPRAPPPASRETARAIAPAASDPRLSIVVLPFRNFGNDPEEDYFAEGITDDLTTDLARVEDSFVISRGTASTYKGEAVDARQLGRELGVRYVLDGRLQREGGRLRVSV